MDTKILINQIIDSITASGKKFKDISKDSIFSLLSRSGIPQNMWDRIYNELAAYYKFEFAAVPGSVKSDRKNISSVVDYSDSSHNDVKTRQPRKSVFTEIKKIGG